MNYGYMYQLLSCYIIHCYINIKSVPYISKPQSDKPFQLRLVKFDVS